jgi:hypothetical protein
MEKPINWRRRALRLGLQQSSIAALLDRSDKWVSRELWMPFTGRASREAHINRAPLAQHLVVKPVDKPELVQQ